MAFEERFKVGHQVGHMSSNINARAQMQTRAPSRPLQGPYAYRMADLIRASTTDTPDGKSIDIPREEWLHVCVNGGSCPDS